MFKNTRNDYIGWLVMFGVIILLLEILFFNHGLIFLLFISGLMIYLGRRRQHKKMGKLLFYGGIIFFIINVFNMMSFKFLLIAILLHFFIQFYNSKRKPNKISVDLREPKNDIQYETMVSSKPLFENIFIGQQKTPAGVYEWDDINIQTGIGDCLIDLSYTMLPKGETVIFIRNIIGNLRILVPYEIEVSVNHSGLIGTANVFENHGTKIFSQVFQLKTPGYDTAEQKVKIFTSTLVGNIEVSRI